MRGTDNRSEGLFSYVSCEARVPSDHPLRLIRAVVDEALEALSGEFQRLYARLGRPSIPPEKLLRALLLQAFYSVRSERQLVEQLDYNLLFRWFVGLQLDYNLLFRWFVGLSMDAPVWDASTFSKNRDRLLAGDVAQAFLAAVVAQPRVEALMSDEHFSVDGTLIQAWASQKSFRRESEDGAPPAPPEGGGRNAGADWRGQKRSNDTHASSTDPDARLARKADGQSSILAYAGHVLMENRSGLVRLACATRATGTAERDASLALVDRRRLAARRRITPGADKNYDARAHVEGLRQRGVTPHIARNDHVTKTGKRRRSAIDGRTTRHPGYAVSQVVRKRIEEIFGWIKTSAGLRQARHRGLLRVGCTFTLAAAAYNLVRLPALLRPAA